MPNNDICNIFSKLAIKKSNRKPKKYNKDLLLILLDCNNINNLEEMPTPKAPRPKCNRK